MNVASICPPMVHPGRSGLTYLAGSTCEGLSCQPLLFSSQASWAEPWSTKPGCRCPFQTEKSFPQENQRRRGPPSGSAIINTDKHHYRFKRNNWNRLTTISQCIYITAKRLFLDRTSSQKWFKWRLLQSWDQTTAGGQIKAIPTPFIYTFPNNR